MIKQHRITFTRDKHLCLIIKMSSKAFLRHNVDKMFVLNVPRNCHVKYVTSYQLHKVRDN